jgi:hypothetical protein
MPLGRIFDAALEAIVLLDEAQRVADGGAYAAGSLAERVVLQLNGAGRAPRRGVLSDRELEVLYRIVAGERRLSGRQRVRRLIDRGPGATPATDDASTDRASPASPGSRRDR